GTGRQAQAMGVDAVRHHLAGAQRVDWEEQDLHRVGRRGAPPRRANGESQRGRHPRAERRKDRGRTLLLQSGGLRAARCGRRELEGRVERQLDRYGVDRKRRPGRRAQRGESSEPSEVDSAGVSASLLGWLRRSLGAPRLEFAKPPARIHGGFDTAIYAFRLADAPAPFAVPLVLRLYRAQRGAAQARFEGAVHRAIAERGYPTPRALAIGEGESELGAFLILEQVAGRNALGALLSPAFARVPALLADAQARLHALDAPDVS